MKTPIQTQVLANKFETLFKERGRPEQLDESFIQELFTGIPVQLDGETIDVNVFPSRLVRTQAIFGGPVSPPALEKFVVLEDEKEYVVVPNITSRSSSQALVIDTSAQVFGVLEGVAKYKIDIVILKDRSILGYFEVFNRGGLLRAWGFDTDRTDHPFARSGYDGATRNR